MADYCLHYHRPTAQAWSSLPLSSQTFSVGRDPGSSLVLDDEQTSRQHALLHVDERGIWLLDQNSSNGVYFCGQRIPAGQWIRLPTNAEFIIGLTTLRVEALAPAAPVTIRESPQPTVQPVPSQPVPAAVRESQPPKRARLNWPLAALLVTCACLCLAGAGAAWFYLPGLRAGLPVVGSQATSLPQGSAAGPAATSQPAEAVLAPPKVIDDLPVSAGSVPIKDDQGVSVSLPAGSLDEGQQASLERASLSAGMQNTIEQAYQVDSLAYAVKLQDGQDATGRADLALPAKSADSRLAVLVDDRWLGILDTPPQDGVFHVAPKAAQVSGAQGYSEPTGSGEKTPNRYLVLTPKTSRNTPGGAVQMAAFHPQDAAGGKSCITEFWTANHCWRNAEGSVYVFWENDVPASLKDQEYLRIEDTIRVVAAIMKKYADKPNGFTAAAIGPRNPAYIIVEAGASEPYYSWKTGNVYVPWDIIASMGAAGPNCDIYHEFFHWIEDEEYRMGAAATSGPKSWWQEVSAENGSFLIDPACIEKNLTKYGLVNTQGNVLGFQAAAAQWDWGEQARYIQALQFYLSLCEGGPGCAMSKDAWVQAINSGTYPLDSAAISAYEKNAKDLGRFLLGAAPAESRGDAAIPPAAISGDHYGDYLSLRTSPRGIWDYGLTMNQFSKPSEQQVKVSAEIAKGGVYPLWVSNGTSTPMGGGVGNRGLPGMLEIQAGPAFWIKQDDGEPVFYPAGKSLTVGPISDKLGVGKARIVAVAPDASQTFQAMLSLVDLTGDWSTQLNPQLTVTPVDCPGYSTGNSDTSSLTAKDDIFLQLLSGYGTYVKKGTSPTDLDLVWQGTMPEKAGAQAESDVKVAGDQITLHYVINIPKPSESGYLLPGLRAPVTARAAQGTPPGANNWLAFWPAMPLVGGVIAWVRRDSRKRSRVGLAALLILGALLLNGCFGMGIWGSIEGTYTFHKLAYVDPQQAAGTDAGATWKLADGQAKINYDLQMEAVTTGTDGSTTKEVQPCKLNMSTTVTGVIAPEGSVKPPDLGK